jgi:heterodisulfide reductase subunit B
LWCALPAVSYFWSRFSDFTTLDKALRKECARVAGDWHFYCTAWYLINTSHVTRLTSHVTRPTSHVTRHTSHVTRHTSHAISVDSFKPPGMQILFTRR